MFVVFVVFVPPNPRPFFPLPPDLNEKALGVKETCSDNSGACSRHLNYMNVSESSRFYCDHDTPLLWNEGAMTNLKIVVASMQIGIWGVKDANFVPDASFIGPGGTIRFGFFDRSNGTIDYVEGCDANNSDTRFSTLDFMNMVATDALTYQTLPKKVKSQKIGLGILMAIGIIIFLIGVKSGDHSALGGAITACIFLFKICDTATDWSAYKNLCECLHCMTEQQVLVNLLSSASVNTIESVTY